VRSTSHKKKEQQKKGEGKGGKIEKNDSTQYVTIKNFPSDNNKSKAARGASFVLGDEGGARPKKKGKQAFIGLKSTTTAEQKNASPWHGPKGNQKKKTWSNRWTKKAADKAKKNTTARDQH